jgi:DNA (cytosine-5)-methyltransferase 1
MSDQLSMFDRPISGATDTRISSPASAVGPTPCSSPAGRTPTSGSSGPDPARANRGAPRGRALAPTIPRDLWPAWFKLIAECSPHVVFGEQTPDALAWFDRVSVDLEGAGYAVGACDLPAACVGAPHIRQRLWFVADANDARRQRAIGTGQSDPTGQRRPAACRESLRSDYRPWPVGPREVDRIPVLAHGVSGVMGGCKGYGNAIVPQVAAEFIAAYLEVAG